MLFEKRFRDGVRDGSIRLTFRRWTQPRVTRGGRYRIGPEGVVEVESITAVRPSRITEVEARRAGFAGCAELLDYVARRGRRLLGHDDELFRVAFRYVPLPDARAAFAASSRLSADAAGRVLARLRSMDGRSRRGPWTLQTLSLIERRPGVRASELAGELQRDVRAFKADVRKLKNLGLTISLETGYRIAPRGRALLRRIDARNPAQPSEGLEEWSQRRDSNS